MQDIEGLIWFGLLLYEQYLMEGLLGCSDPIELDTKTAKISEQYPVAVHGNDTRIQQVSSIPMTNGCVLSYKQPR